MKMPSLAQYEWVRVYLRGSSSFFEGDFVGYQSDSGAMVMVLLTDTMAKGRQQLAYIDTLQIVAWEQRPRDN